MKTEIKKTIEILKERVEVNKQIIDRNRKLLRYVIEQPVSDTRTELFTRHFEKNLELYSSNYLYIKLQYELHRAMSQDESLKTFGMMSLS
jgi:GTP-sensing pleiotropic transcriptional regulator CodY